MTIPSLALLLTVLFQDPSAAAAAAAAPQRLDQIELASGEVLEGRIVLERGNYVEIELSPGAVVGFRKTEVKTVRRGAGTVPTQPGPGQLAPLDEWFTLHDAAGRAVGWLHTTITAGTDGGSRLLEEWEFQKDRRYYQVTALETADGSGAPLSSYFRERISEETLGAPDDAMARKARIREERIVEATVDGAVLQVRCLSSDGRRERALPWPDGATFPLLARVRHDDASAREVTVFDPAVEELQTRVLGAARPRTVAIDGRQQQVAERIESAFGTDNAVWTDAGGRVVRREVAGPGLVALPSVAEAARRAVQIGAQQPPQFVAEVERRFGVWLPNPAWTARPVAAGSLALSCAVHDATISCSLLDHLDPGATLDVAATAVERWAVLLDPEVEIDGRTFVRVRDRDAVRIAASTAAGRTGTGRATRALFVIVPTQGAFLVVRCRASASAWDELSADFESVITRLELEPRGVAALMTGEGEAVPAAVAAPRSTTAAATPPPRSTSRVRIPRDADLAPPVDPAVAARRR